MKSFLQSDSTYRAEKGGKGVGRFAWLKAFKEADIESSFIDAGEWVRRKFALHWSKMKLMIRWNLLNL